MSPRVKQINGAKKKLVKKYLEEIFRSIKKSKKCDKERFIRNPGSGLQT